MQPADAIQLRAIRNGLVPCGPAETMTMNVIPAFGPNGSLPPGIHAATLREVVERFGRSSGARQRQIKLVTEIVAAAGVYVSIKRVLLWGSFVTSKADPADVDYSVVVGVNYDRTSIADGHTRFLVPWSARQRYGVDAGYVVVADYPLELFVERLDFLCRDGGGRPRGIVEISIRGETAGDVE